MALYPEVQSLAQAELDRVVSHDRLPQLSDRSSLPYVEAVMREVLRWNPTTPLGPSPAPEYWISEIDSIAQAYRTSW
jgi:cytochrome P450